MSLIGAKTYYAPDIIEDYGDPYYDEYFPVSEYPGRLGGYGDDLYLAEREAQLAVAEGQAAEVEAYAAQEARAEAYQARAIADAEAEAYNYQVERVNAEQDLVNAEAYRNAAYRDAAYEDAAYRRDLYDLEYDYNRGYDGVGYGLGLLDGYDYYGYGDLVSGGLDGLYSDPSLSHLRGDYGYGYGYGTLGAYDIAELGLERTEWEEDFRALQDLRLYEDALRLDSAISEHERLNRWRRRLAWEELTLEERRLHWDRMAEEDREILGLGRAGWWGRRFLGDWTGGYHGAVGYYGSGLDNWGHAYVGLHGGPGSYAARHPEIPNTNPIPRYAGYGFGYYGHQVGPDPRQLARLYGKEGIYSRGHYPLSRNLASRYDPILTRLARRRAGVRRGGAGIRGY